jgi:hypothetical protein
MKGSIKLSLHCRLCLLCALLQIHAAASKLSHIELCSIKSSPIFLIRRNPTTGEYVLDKHRALAAEEGMPTDNMESSEISPWNSGEISNPILPLAKTMGDGLLITNWEKQYARPCCDSDPKSDVYFCLLPATHCAADDVWTGRNEKSTPRCVFQTQTTIFVRRLWPFILTLYGCLATFLVFTKAGRGIINYVIGLFYPWWNERVADGMLENDTFRADELVRMHISRQRREIALRYRMMMGSVSNDSGNQEPRELMALILRTRRYKAPQNGNVADANDDERDDPSCSICYEPLEHDEKIGILPCDHLFHSKCLKTWLARRNVCPLCQATEVATPKYADEDTEEQTVSFDEEDNIDSNNSTPTYHSLSSLRNLLGHLQ